MQYLNLNSTPTYSKFATVPIVQQVMGVTGIFKNTVLLISDMAFKIIFFGQITSDIEKKFKDRAQTSIKHSQKIKKHIVALNNYIDMLNGSKLSLERKINLAKPINNVIADINLALKLDKIESEPIFKNLNFTGNSPGESIVKIMEVQGKLEKIIQKNDITINILYWLTPLTLSKRVQNIALGIITLIPVISTIYHLTLLKLIFSKVET